VATCVDPGTTLGLQVTVSNAGLMVSF
jgi:hypothetical protein